MPCKPTQSRFTGHIAYTVILFSEFDNFRFMGECTDCSSCILKIKYLGVAIVCRIHLLKGWICIQHRLSGFYSVILYQFPCNSDPFTIFECTDLCFRVSQQLFGYVFYFSGLYIQLSLVKMSCSEWSYSRLISFYSCQIISFCFFQKLGYFFDSCHFVFPFHSKYLTLL